MGDASEALGSKARNDTHYDVACEFKQSRWDEPTGFDVGRCRVQHLSSVVVIEAKIRKGLSSVEVEDGRAEFARTPRIFTPLRSRRLARGAKYYDEAGLAGLLLWPDRCCRSAFG